MDLTYFHTFREVARKQSFTRAAEELGYAQSSITMQMQKLEKEYGVPLFERYGKSMRLTPPGEELLKIVIPMLDLYAQSKETITQQASGTLTIGTIDSLAAYFLPPYLQRLKQAVPGLSIQLYPESEALLLNKIKDGEYDVGLLLDQNRADPSLTCISIRKEPLVLIAPPGHPLTYKKELLLEELNESEFIVSEGSCLYRSTFEKLLKDQGIVFKIGFELGSLEAIKQCVRNGLGIALLPRIAVEEELSRGSLQVIPFDHPELCFYLQLVIHPRKWKSYALDTFTQMLIADNRADV